MTTLCPITTHPCAREPQCKKTHQDQGSTHCAEWVLKQRIEGRKQLEQDRNGKASTTHSDGASSTNNQSRR